jgi:hypothetical protein
LRKDEDFNHEIHRLRPVFARSRGYAGALIHTAGSWDAHDASGQRIGSYPKADLAMTRLRSLVTGRST